MRGYDDGKLLEEIAVGIFEQRFASVDEGAKFVTGEDGGANVDRLRRKYRTENWFRRGLEIYTARKIAEHLIATAVVDGPDVSVDRHQYGSGPRAHDAFAVIREKLVWAVSALKYYAVFVWLVFLHVVKKAVSLLWNYEHGKRLPLRETVGRAFIFATPFAIYIFVSTLPGALIGFYRIDEHTELTVGPMFSLLTIITIVPPCILSHWVTKERWWSGFTIPNRLR